MFICVWSKHYSKFLLDTRLRNGTNQAIDVGLIKMWKDDVFASSSGLNFSLEDNALNIAIMNTRTLYIF